jgi:hypothetical protein
MSSEELATASIAPAEGEVHESENTEPQEGNTTWKPQIGHARFVTGP